MRVQSKFLRDMKKKEQKVSETAPKATPTSNSDTKIQHQQKKEELKKMLVYRTEAAKILFDL